MCLRNVSSVMNVLFKRGYKRFSIIGSERENWKGTGWSVLIFGTHIVSSAAPTWLNFQDYGSPSVITSVDFGHFFNLHPWLYFFKWDPHNLSSTGGMFDISSFFVKIQTVKCPVIWDAVTLMWHHCNIRDSTRIKPNPQLWSFIQIGWPYDAVIREKLRQWFPVIFTHPDFRFDWECGLYFLSNGLHYKSCN